MPEPLDQRRHLLNLRTRTNQRLYQHNNNTGKNQATVKLFLQGFILGWQSVHHEWQASKQTAKKEGVDVSLFGQGLGRQHDDLVAAIKNAQLINEQYGDLSPQGKRSLQERLARLKATINDYIRICERRGLREKHPERTKLAWQFLHNTLKNMLAQTANYSGQLDRLR